MCSACCRRCWNCRCRNTPITGSSLKAMDEKCPSVKARDRCGIIGLLAFSRTRSLQCCNALDAERLTAEHLYASHDQDLHCPDLWQKRHNSFPKCTGLPWNFRAKACITPWDVSNGIREHASHEDHEKGKQRSPRTAHGKPLRSNAFLW